MDTRKSHLTPSINQHENPPDYQNQHSTSRTQQTDTEANKGKRIMNSQLHADGFQLVTDKRTSRTSNMLPTKLRLPRTQKAHQQLPEANLSCPFNKL